jgi:glycerophosphoryl diester phosphodiesterase
MLVSSFRRPEFPMPPGARDQSPAAHFETWLGTGRACQPEVRTLQSKVMKLPNALKGPILDTTDLVMSLWPRPRPSNEQLKHARIVAHRGYCAVGVKENTLESFRAAVAHGAWALEFDLRWTTDHLPMVHHDKTALRVFNEDIAIDSLSFPECRKRFSLIPTFEELVAEFGGKVHLMIEIKDPVSGNQRRIDSIAKALKNLEPVRDYHLMSLNLDSLLECKFVPPKAWLPIAEFNVARMSQIAIEKNMAGLTGQYVLLDNETIRRHHDVGQKIGTGFIASRSVFNREVRRDVDWIFTNHAANIQAWAK